MLALFVILNYFLFDHFSNHISIIINLALRQKRPSVDREPIMPWRLTLLLLHRAEDGGEDEVKGAKHVQLAHVHFFFGFIEGLVQWCL